MEHAPNSIQAAHQFVDIALVVVESERRAATGEVLNAKPGEKRLGAMMASANGDLVHVEDARHVVRVNAVHVEAPDAMMHVCIGVADDGDEAELAELFHTIGHKSLSRASTTSMPTDST